MVGDKELHARENPLILQDLMERNDIVRVAYSDWRLGKERIALLEKIREAAECLCAEFQKTGGFADWRDFSALKINLNEYKEKFGDGK
jgi:hypothetical protein